MKEPNLMRHPGQDGKTGDESPRADPAPGRVTAAARRVTRRASGCYVRGVRVLGALVFLAGCAGTMWATMGIHLRRRPADVAFAVLAPVAALIALVGLLLVFVPGFFG